MHVFLISVLAIPVSAALLLLLFRGSLLPHTARWIALGGALAAVLASLALLQAYQTLPAAADNEVAGPIHPKYEIRLPWYTVGAAAPDENSVRLELHLGLDGISVALIVLTSVLTLSSVLISWNSIQTRAAEFFASLMLLEAGLIGVFCAFDLILFYVFFEFTLIPLFFLIAIWGGPERRHAAVKFFLYTLSGSLVTLLGLIALALHAAASGLATPCSIPELAAWLTANPLDASTQTLLFLMLSTGLLIKVPVFPFHTWLPLAHVEAPTAGSVLLAGVLLKLGTYGFLRLCLPMLPEGCLAVGVPLIGVLSVVGIIYGSLCCLAQRDIKKLIAYSSVAHLGFCMLGLFALNVEGISGGVLQMINHGLSTGALFLLIGMVYDRYHTRHLDDLGGLGHRLPLLTCGMVFICMASIGLPGLNGFVGEMLSLAGMFERHLLLGALGATGVVLGAWYLLTMLQHGFFGPLKEPHADEPAVADISLRELLALGPLAAACLWIGVYPAPVLELIRPDVATVAALYDESGAGGQRQAFGRQSRELKRAVAVRAESVSDRSLTLSALTATPPRPGSDIEPMIDKRGDLRP
jgi:NADH-quinone oxidoreductase subunit M